MGYKTRYLHVQMMVADAANPEIIEATLMVGRGENRELIGADGIIVKD